MDKGTAIAERRAPDLPRLGYRPREVARMTGLAAPTIYKWIASGELKAVRNGRTLIVPAEEVNRLMAGSAA